jgi:N-acyl-D-aspartate/D-glutamate deacylase
VIGTSDGGGRPHIADQYETSTHLLGYRGCEHQAMPLEDVVYRLIGETALKHDITDCGFIAAGQVTDITIFDPNTIAPKPREPVASLAGGGVPVKREAVGIDKVIVNGTVLLANGEVTSALPGQIIRGPLYPGAQA